MHRKYGMSDGAEPDAITVDYGDSNGAVKD